MDTLTISVLPIQEQGISFHLFVSSSLSFINILQFSVYRSFTSLAKFTCSYFILFDTVVNGIGFSFFSNILFIYLFIYFGCVRS